MALGGSYIKPYLIGIIPDKYLNLIEDVVKSGKQAIMLAPDTTSDSGLFLCA